MNTPSKAYTPPSNRRGLTGDRKLLKLSEVATVIDVEFALPGAYLIIVQLTDPSNSLSQTIAHVRIITGVARTPTSDVTTIVNGVNQVVLARSVTVIVENSERDAVVAPTVLDVRAVVVPITIEADPSLFGSPEGIFPFGPSVSVDGIDGRHQPASGGAVPQSIVASMFVLETCRKGATIYNASGAILYIALRGLPANVSATDFTVALFPNDYFEVPFGYSGPIQGVWSAAGAGFATVYIIPS